MLRDSRIGPACNALIATYGHELRTPLQAIVGYADLLKTSPTLEEGDRLFVERISAAGEALVGVMNAMLATARDEAALAA